MTAADILNACTFWHMNKKGPSNPNEFAKDVGQVVRWWKRSLTCRLFETNKKVLAWQKQFGDFEVKFFPLKGNRMEGDVGPWEDTIRGAEQAREWRNPSFYFKSISLIEDGIKSGALAAYAEELKNNQAQRSRQ
jgi:hypothetical protein